MATKVLDLAMNKETKDLRTKAADAEAVASAPELALVRVPPVADGVVVV